jgi:hypothetical protein
VEVDPARVWPLPELLERILGMPCILGVAEIEGELHWMLDTHRLTIPASGG